MESIKFRGNKLASDIFNVLSSEFCEAFSTLTITRDVKLYPIVCGSLVEGLVTIGSDVDFALLVEGKPRRYILIKKLLMNFLRDTEVLLKSNFELSGFCYFSQFIRRTTTLLNPKRGNVNFRLHFYTFSKLLNVDLHFTASGNDLISLKEELVRNLGRYYEGISFKIKYPLNATPKSLLKTIQLKINHSILLSLKDNFSLMHLTSLNIFEKVYRYIGKLKGLKRDADLLIKAITVLFILKTRYREMNMKRISLKKLFTYGYITESDLKLITEALERLDKITKHS